MKNAANPGATANEHVRHGLCLSFDMMVSHHMAGGRIQSWVEGLAYARHHGVSIDVMNGAARDLIGAHGSGITLTEHIQLAQRAGIADMRFVPFNSLQKKTPDSAATRQTGGLLA